MIQNINVSIDKQISQYVNEIHELNNRINTSNINGNDNEVNIDSVVNKMIENPSAYSEEEIIRQAEISFAQKDYNKVLKLYSLDQVANSDIIYNNLAYMYSNGLGVDKNIEKAETYYLKTDNIASYEAMLIKNIKGDNAEEILNILKHNLNNSDNRISKAILDMNNDDIDQAIGSLNDLNTFVNNYYGDWEFKGNEKHYLIYSDALTDSYKNYHESDEFEGDAVSSYFTCDHYQRKCRILDSYNECFIML